MIKRVFLAFLISAGAVLGASNFDQATSRNYSQLQKQREEIAPLLQVASSAELEAAQDELDKLFKDFPDPTDSVLKPDTENPLLFKDFPESKKSDSNQEESDTCILL